MIASKICDKFDNPPSKVTESEKVFNGLYEPGLVHAKTK